MKKVSPLSFFGAWTLVFCATLGAPLCVITAYDLPHGTLAMVMMAFAVSGFMTLLFSMPRLGGFLLLPLGGGAVLFGVLRWRRLYSGALVALNTIQSALSRSLFFISEPGNLPSGTENYAFFIAFFVGVVMLAMALLISWGLVSGESMVLPLLVPLPLVALSLIYADMQPAGWAGVLMCLYYGGVLFTAGLRLHHGRGVGRVTFLALAMLGLTLLLLVKILPEERFEPFTPQEWLGSLLERATRGWEKVSRSLESDISDREDLSQAGEMKSTGEHIMDVKTSVTGIMYLRGNSFGEYDGHYWNMTGEYDDMESLFTLGRSLADPKEQMEVKNVSTTLLYTPYAVVRGGSDLKVRENYVKADRKVTEYSWNFRLLSDEAVTPRTGNPAERAYAQWAKKTYVTLSKLQQAELLDFLKPYELPDADDPYELALAITAILRGTVAYDTKTEPMPEDQDFVLYFLTVSKRGYCVHYASALTALLQAKGVPARFVVGYGVKIEAADEWVEITDKNAHAWTEVYVDGWGWVPVEATGGDDPRFQNASPLPDQGEEPTQEPPPTSQPQPTGEPQTTGEPQATMGPEETPEAEETPEPTPLPSPEPSGEPQDTMDPGEEPSEPTPEPTPGPTPEPTPEPTSEPEGGVSSPTPPPPEEGSAGEEEPEEKSGKRWLLWLLWLLLLPALVYLHLRLRRQANRMRTRRMLQGDGRKAVLYSYGELLKLTRRGASLSEDARALADEAAFSDHVLGEEHKRTMLGFVKAARRELEQKLPRYKIWYLRYLLWLW